MGQRNPQLERHCGRLPGRSLFQRLRSALHLRGYLPDAKPHRRQSRNRLERLSVIKCLTNNLNFKEEPFMSTTTTELNLETILYAKKGAIAYVTLNPPKVLNALNKRTWEDLKAAFEDAQDDAAVRGVILTGAGDKAFIAGADISELAQISAVEAEKSSTCGQDVLNLIENLGKPVIAAVNGFALGGGCETAMASTIRIAAENAKLGEPEVKLGVIPGGGGTQRLPPLVGKGRALQLILSGVIITAQEAYRIGLVNEVV